MIIFASPEGPPLSFFELGQTGNETGKEMKIPMQLIDGDSRRSLTGIIPNTAILSVIIAITVVRFRFSVPSKKASA